MEIVEEGPMVGGGGLVRYSSPNIFPPNLGGWDPHTGSANLYT